MTPRAQLSLAAALLLSLAVVSPCAAVYGDAFDTLQLSPAPLSSGFSWTKAGTIFGYSSSSAAKTLSVANAKKFLNNTVITAAVAVSTTSRGSVYARIAAGSPNLAAAQALGVGQSMPLTASDLEGPYMWLLANYTPANFGGLMTWKYIAVGTDPAIGSDRTEVTKQVISTMAAAGVTVDVVLEALQLSSSLQGTLRFSTPILGYGYTVLAPRAYIHEDPLPRQIFLWVRCARFPAALAPARCKAARPAPSAVVVLLLRCQRRWAAPLPPCTGLCGSMRRA